jgi:alkane 1-monooxygenase
MPLLEAEASVGSACISTAPVFARTAADRDGAAKSRDLGWWALMEHNRERPFGARSNWMASAAWAVWLAGLVASGLLPWGRFRAAEIGLVCVSIWLPDHGDTVLPFYSVVILPMVVFKSVAAGGWWSYSILFDVFVVIPFFDFVVGVDVGNQTRAVQRELHTAFRFELLTLLVAPGILACLGYAAWLANFGGLSYLELGGLCIGTGIITGVIGIVVGHELCHKASRLERAFGRLLLCAACYGHFYVEHTLGHHKDVATDQDPATSRYGESFYEFLPRVVKGEFVSACRIEAARLQRKGLPWWHSEIPAYFMVSVAMALGLAAATGPLAAPLFLAQSAVAVLLFESVNYVEHYGLERRELRPGEYESVQPQHSWDTPARITNQILLKLARHADHHAHAGKRYQTLQAYDASPQLPGGYATVIFLAFFPPLWRMVMHPRLLAHRRQQVGQIFRHGPTPEPEIAVRGAGKSERSPSAEKQLACRLRRAGA